MKTYKGIIKGNTIILDETPDLPRETEAIVSIKVIDSIREEEIIKKQLEQLRNPHHGGKLLYKRREELYDR
jgi:hypothetical protein